MSSAISASTPAAPTSCTRSSTAGINGPPPSSRSTRTNAVTVANYLTPSAHGAIGVQALLALGRWMSERVTLDKDEPRTNGGECGLRGVGDCEQGRRVARRDGGDGQPVPGRDGRVGR